MCFEVLTLKREGDEVIEALKAAIAEEESPHVCVCVRACVCRLAPCAVHAALRAALRSWPRAA